MFGDTNQCDPVEPTDMFYDYFKSVPISEMCRILFTVGNVDRDIGRHSGRYSGRQSVDSRSTVGR